MLSDEFNIVFRIIQTVLSIKLLLRAMGDFQSMEKNGLQGNEQKLILWSN